MCNVPETYRRVYACNVNIAQQTDSATSSRQTLFINDKGKHWSKLKAYSSWAENRNGMLTCLHEIDSQLTI